MKQIDVVYQGWGEQFHLGTLAESGRTVMFEYSPQALSRGLEISPLKLKLQPEAFHDFPFTQYQLPGVVADALPDGWGLLLMDRLFRKSQFPVPTALDRLAFIHDRAMGALSFEPGDNMPMTSANMDLLRLAQESQAVLSDRESVDALRELAVMGGSPHGARPKVLLNYDPQTGRVYGAEDAPGAPWLFKFPAQHEHKEVAEIEALYGALAHAAGLDMPNVVSIDLSDDLSAFGIRRFDRERGMRVPMLTVAGAMDLDFRQPGIIDYENLLRITRAVTRDEREVQVMYERCVFNVVFNNRDDHVKNFSFRMNQEGYWQVAPCYDLTFNRGPQGYHQMDIDGEAMAPKRADLLRMAAKAGVTKVLAERTLDRIAEVASQFKTLASGYHIRNATLAEMASHVISNQARLKR